MLVIMLGSVSETDYCHNVPKEITYLVQGMVFDIDKAYSDSAGYIPLGKGDGELPWVKPEMYTPVAGHFLSHKSPTTSEMESFHMLYNFYPCLIEYTYN